MTTTTACVICGTPRPRATTGRPPSYCSVACRRVAEFELRRLDRQLGDLEVDRDDARSTLAQYERFGPPGTRSVAIEEHALAEAEQAIATKTERMRLLLAGGARPRPDAPARKPRPPRQED